MRRLLTLMVLAALIAPTPSLQAEPLAAHNKRRDDSCTAANYTIARDKDGRVESYTSKRHGFRFSPFAGSSTLRSCMIGGNGEIIVYESDPAYVTHEQCAVVIGFRFFPGLANQLRPSIEGTAAQWAASTTAKPIAPPDIREAIIPIPDRKLSVYQASVKTTGADGARGKLEFGYASGNDLVMLSVTNPEDDFCKSAKKEVGAFIGKFPWP